MSRRSHVDTLDGATRFRLFRNCRTYEGAIVRQAGPKTTCSSREGSLFLQADVPTCLVDFLRGRMLRETELPSRVQCAVSPCEDPWHPPTK